MTKSEEAVQYLIEVYDEVRGNWREKPDHVEQKLLEAEKEIKENNISIKELEDRLQAGRDYLMTVKKSNINAEDALEALGFGRNGLQYDS